MSLTSLTKKGIHKAFKAPCELSLNLQRSRMPSHLREVPLDKLTREQFVEIEYSDPSMIYESTSDIFGEVAGGVINKYFVIPVGEIVSKTLIQSDKAIGGFMYDVYHMTKDDDKNSPNGMD